MASNECQEATLKVSVPNDLKELFFLIKTQQISIKPGQLVFRETVIPTSPYELDILG